MAILTFIAKLVIFRFVSVVVSSVAVLRDGEIAAIIICYILVTALLIAGVIYLLKDRKGELNVYDIFW